MAILSKCAVLGTVMLAAAVDITPETITMCLAGIAVWVRLEHRLTVLETLIKPKTKK